MMEAITRLNRWANAHTNLVIDMLRVLFGAFISFKGIFCLQQTEYLSALLKIAGGPGAYYILIYYVGLAHFLGGLFIIFGFITRLSALLQLPALVGAVTINFIGAMNAANLLQAIFCFFICSFFLLYGSGKHSVDYALRLHM